MELDQSRIKLKTALHGLEAAINKLVHGMKALQQENDKLKAEISSIRQAESVVMPPKHSDVRGDVGPKTGTLDMLDPTAVSSIDMSINELKNMVKSK